MDWRLGLANVVLSAVLAVAILSAALWYVVRYLPRDLRNLWRRMCAVNRRVSRP